MQFRKKPVVVEAFQITLKTRWDNSEWPEWLNRAWNEPRGSVGSVSPWHDRPPCNELQCTTLEGDMKVTIDDWIIRGVKGELYPCKPDIFAATYEQA